MLTKSKIIEIVRQAELTQISLDYIEGFLVEMKDDEYVPVDKAIVIIEIIKSEEEFNKILAESLSYNLT